MHLSVFKRLGIPYHIGVYVVFLLGTIINFFSFSRFIGKEKAFLAIELYLLMPSTSLLSFCITHELFVYFYFSIIFVFLNLLAGSDEIKKSVSAAIGLTFFVCMNQTISPMGKIWFIVLFLLIALSKLSWKKKGIIALVLLLSYFGSDLLTTSLQDNHLNLL